MAGEAEGLGKTTPYAYDNLGRVETMTLPRPNPSFPENFVITYSYDHSWSPDPIFDLGGKCAKITP